MAWSQQTQLLDFLADLGVTHINLAVLCAAREDGRRVMRGDARARDRAETEKCFGWAWYENVRGGDVYFRPARWLPDGSPGRWPLVFLDDVTRDVALALARAHKCAVIETSPSRHHVWLATDRALDETERATVQAQLAKQYGGDPGSTSGEHFGRMPGYKNQKRGGCFVNIVTIQRTAAVIDTSTLLQAAPLARSAPRARACVSRDRDLYSSLGGWSSESEREFGFVIGRLRWLSQRGDASAVAAEAQRLTAELAARAEARGKRNARDYAQRTVNAALARIR